MKHLVRWALGGALLACLLLAAFLLRRPSPAPRLRGVGPKTVSNQTSQPLLLVGDDLRPGLILNVSRPGEHGASMHLPLTVVDAHHAYARLPPVALPAARTQATFRLFVEGDAARGVALTVVNDARFPDLTHMAISPRGRLFVTSGPTDQLFEVDPGTHAVRSLPAGDGPSALASFARGGKRWLAVAHTFIPELWVFPADLSGPPRKLPAPMRVSALVPAPSGDVLYLAEQVDDTVEAVSTADGHRLWRTPVDPNPRAMALEGDLLAVGSAQTGRIQFLDRRTGHATRAIQPRAGVAIIGGRTQGYGRWVMGGTAVRALCFAPGLDRLFAASEGPNVGPNPQRMEVTLNPGVGVVAPSGAGFVRHLGFGEGLIQALTFDPTRKLLYAADVGLGRVRVLDAARLAGSDETSRTALLQSLTLPPPPGFPRLWRNRTVSASTSSARTPNPALESGPTDLALSPDGKALWVLNRFTGTLAEVDVRQAASGKAFVQEQIPVVGTLGEPTRRFGQILFQTDAAGTGITCEGCHVEGHTGGIFFAKTRPLRIYRSPTLRGAKSTPPYFNPASTRSLAGTVKLVGNRNRFHRLPFSAKEIDALTTYAATVTVPPNPFRATSGAPPKRLRLPWGKSGTPANGRALFQGKAGCVRCHPAPLYTLDQDGPTRGRYLDVGTPPGLPLRKKLQDLRVRRFEVPSLLGAWDVFPMLTSGSAGLEVSGDSVQPGTRWPLRWVARHPHGGTPGLSPSEVADLVAFLRAR